MGITASKIKDLNCTITEELNLTNNDVRPIEIQMIGKYGNYQIVKIMDYYFVLFYWCY